MADAGLSPLAAITAGTRNAAAAMGVSDRIGTIEPGKEADLLVVEGDPSHKLENLRKVAAVFRGGEKVPGNLENRPKGGLLRACRRIW